MYGLLCFYYINSLEYLHTWAFSGSKKAINGLLGEVEVSHLHNILVIICILGIALDVGNNYVSETNI